MGYPINKQWERPASNPNATIQDLISANSHMKLVEFKIYRYNKLRVTQEEEKDGDLVVAFNNWMNILEEKQGS